MSTELPSAEEQSPACGACQSETTFDGNVFLCEDCGLSFDGDDLSASFIDGSLDPCGLYCDNGWHGANKIKPGLSFACEGCKLPAGHSSMHWTGCREVFA